MRQPLASTQRPRLVVRHLEGSEISPHQVGLEAASRRRLHRTVRRRRAEMMDQGMIRLAWVAGLFDTVACTMQGVCGLRWRVCDGRENFGKSGRPKPEEGGIE